MNKKWSLREIYLAFLAFTLLIYGGYSLFINNGIDDYASQIMKAEQKIVKVEEVSSNPVIFRGTEVDGKAYTIAFTEAVGYQSTIKVMTMVDDAGQIERVDVIEQGETVAFFERIKSAKFTDQFQNLNVFESVYIGNAEGYAGSSEGIDTDNEVDGISGATISSVAITKAVNDAVVAVADKIFGEVVESLFYEMSIGWEDFALLLIFLIAVLSLFINELKRYKKWILVYSVIVTGFIINKFITFGTLYSFFRMEWPSVTNLSWYILIISTFGLILLTGKNMYCSWVCPFGASQEVILKLGGFKQKKLHPKLVKVFRLIPPTLAYIALMITFYTQNTQALSYDPFGAIFTLTALPIMWITLPILIFISLFQFRFYCTYFCPIGYILNLTAKLRNRGAQLWKIGKNKNIKEKM